MTSGTIILSDTTSIEQGVEIRAIRSKSWSGSDDPISKSNYNNWNCTFYSLRPDLIKDPYGNWWANGIPSGNWPAPVYQLDVITLLNDVQSATKSGVNAIVSLAESRETVAALAEKIEALSKFILTAKRGGFGRALSSYRRTLGATPAKEVSNRWLEMHFGWLPLMQEIQSIFDGLQSASSVPIPDFTVNCKQKYKAESLASDNYPIGQLSPIDTKITRRSSYRVEVKYGHPPLTFSGYLGVPPFPFELYDAVHSGNLLRVYRAFKYHFEEFGIQVTEGAWNIAPFSFVIDWFLPVGDYLAALRTFKEYDFKSIRVTEKHTLEAISFLTMWGSLVGYELIPGYDKKITYIRRPLSDLVLSRPQFSFEYKSLTHAIHSAALINGLLPDKRVRF